MNLKTTPFLFAIVLAISVLASGCKNKDCDQAFSLKNDLNIVESVLTNAMNDSNLIANTCNALHKTWLKRVSNGSDFAMKIANKRFYTETKTCVHRHYEMRCNWVSGDRYLPDPSGRHRRDWGRSSPYHNECRQEAVCDEYRVDTKFKDGFAQCEKVAHALTLTNRWMTAGCKSASVKSTKIYFNESLRDLELATTNLESVLQKAGCYKN